MTAHQALPYAMRKMLALSKWIAAVRGKAVSTIYRLTGGLDLFHFTDYESYLQAGSRKLWALYKAQDIIAKAVNSTPIGIYRKGSTTVAKVPELDQLFRFCNQHENIADLLYKSVFHLGLTGMAFWLKSEVTLAGDRPRELFALNPARLKFVLDSQMAITKYIYYSGGTPIPLTFDEVIVFKTPHPNNDILGLGVVEAGEGLMENALNRQNYQKAFWRNGGAPSGVMIAEESNAATDEETWQRAKRKWDAEYGGKENGGKIGWLAGKWKYERLGLTATEMEDLEKTKYDIAQIFMLCGVPLSIAGVENAAAYATAEIDRENFLEFTVLPIIRNFEKTLQTDLIDGFGSNLEIRFNLSRLVNRARVVRELVPLAQAGVVSINEVREAAGFQKINEPLYDQHFIASTSTPLELAGVNQSDQQTQQQAQRAIDRFVEKALSKIETEKET